MHVYLLSPYHGGSHQVWAEGYQRHSRHKVHLLTLPARFWKWRMFGGAITLARQFDELAAEARPENAIILATDMLDLTTFLALTRHKTTAVPVALYMHENQLTYPLPARDPRSGGRRQLREADRHYALINLTSMLAADRIFFNSAYHRDSLLAALPSLLNHFPEYNELQAIDVVAERSVVLPVGIDFTRLEPQPQGKRADNCRPLVLWNQRWEYDKNPQLFLDVLLTLAGEGLTFDVALCGERFGVHAPAFDRAAAELGDRVIQFGYADDDRYRDLLWQADVTFSTARHEFFGISILEAIYAHTLPILPRRLSYPELIPEAFHTHCLYDRRPGLLSRLRKAFADPAAARETAANLAVFANQFSWTAQAPHYDEAFEQLRLDS